MSKKSFFLFAALCTSSMVFSQQDTVFSQLNEVTVTATKSPKKASETGKVVTIINKATLERSVGKDLSQVLTEQAGLVINGATSNPAKDKSVFLRGAKNDYTVILINGIPVTDPTGVGGAFDLRMIPLDQVERIEILKGAQSTLYGSDAIAGVINIITARGAGKAAQLAGNLSTGSYGSRKAYAGLNGNTEKVSYNVGFTHQEYSGLSEAKDTTGTKGFDKDGSLQNALQFNIDGEILENLHIKPFLRYTFFKGDFDDGAFADGKGKYRAELMSTGAIAQWQYSKGFINAQYQYDAVNRRYNTRFGLTDFTGRSLLAEIYGQYNINPHLQLLAGIDHRVQQVIDTNTIVKDPLIKITSPYAALYIKNLQGLNIELGGRYNRHSKFGENFTYSINPSYLVKENIKLFVNIASAFKAPPIATLYGQYGANPELLPERSQTYEGGVQAGFFKDALEARVVYFRRNTRDVVVYGPAFTYINLDRQDDEGIEIEPSVKINDALTVKLYYTYVDGNVTTQSKTSGKDTSYNNLIRKPRQSFGLNVGYQATKQLFVSANLYHYGRRDDLFFSTRQQAVTLKGYTLLNAYAEYGFLRNHIKVFADLKNITNTRYYEVYGYSTPGFNMNAGLSFRL